jgi:hypothetical protein
MGFLVSLFQDNIPWSLYCLVEEIHGEQCPQNKKKTVSITLTFDRT